MCKKLIAMILACTMLVSISPAVAAENASAKPTVEEILNEYHRAAFEAQCTDDAATAATYSPRSGHSSKTLEQETVDTLNAAGYEAYNVTPANYNTLEGQLNTDFADMGLDPEGSYIIVIHGEDSDNSNTANSNGSRAIVPAPDPGGTPSSFNYTYNGTTYTMRYVTVTAAENLALAQISNPVQLLDICPEDLTSEVLNLILSVSSLIPALSIYSSEITLLSLLISTIPNAEITRPRSLTYKAKSSWYAKYTQVYHSGNEEWKLCAGVEYVIPQYEIEYDFTDPLTGLWDVEEVQGQLTTIYSEHYYDNEYIKQVAAMAFEYNTFSMDAVDRVVYEYYGSVIATHYRNWEFIDFVPTL